MSSVHVEATNVDVVLDHNGTRKVATATTGNTVVVGKLPDGISVDSLASSYTHDQPAAARIWSIEHNLGFRPACTAVDAAGNVIVGTLDHVDANNLTITHGSPYSGSAYLS